MFRLGQDCLCRKEAPHVGRFTFPFCWRCSGLLVGGLLGSLALGWLRLPPATLLFSLFGFLSVLPGTLDVLCQVLTSYRSNYRRRLATGLLLGTGIALFSHVFVTCLPSPF